jgi:hypothetical protein
MAKEKPLDTRTDGTPPGPSVTNRLGTQTDPSLGDLFRQLAQESTTLIRQEMELVKVEMRENARSFARDATKLAIGGGLLLVAALVLTAALAVLLGDLLGNYWLGTLIVGALYGIMGMVMMQRGKKGLETDDLKPEHSIASLQEDKRWAQAEVQQVKRELTS